MIANFINREAIYLNLGVLETLNIGIYVAYDETVKTESFYALNTLDVSVKQNLIVLRQERKSLA